MIPSLVLTAGLATRLRPLSHVRAKAALPVAEEHVDHPDVVVGGDGVRGAVPVHVAYGKSPCALAG